jgi:hypothetical protein
LWELWDGCLDGSSEIVVLMGALRLLSWCELWDCCLHGSSEIVVFMGASRQQSQSSHHDNNLRPLIKTTIWEFHQDNTLSGPIRTTIWELPSRHKSQSSNQDNHLRAPIDCCLDENSENVVYVVLMGALRCWSWWELWDCCLDGIS